MSQRTAEDIQNDKKKHKTIMNLDYSHNHDILAVCGNFADMRLIKGDLSHLMSKSFKLAKED